MFGAQLANLLPQPKYDGVLGIWYGKGPGVDRSGDAFRHANLTGVGQYGGVLAVAGDDPASKSSTVPSASEVALFDAQMPVLYPGDVQGILDLGLMGFALSRYSGLWVGFKLTTNVADEFSTANVGADRASLGAAGVRVQRKAVGRRPRRHTLFAPYNLDLEQELWEGRLEAARHFAVANRLNRIVVDSPGAWIGIVAAGKTYLDLREALARLDLTEADLNRFGIQHSPRGHAVPARLRDARARFATRPRRGPRHRGEALVPRAAGARRALQHAGPPRVVGKRDEQDRILVPGPRRARGRQPAADPRRAASRPHRRHRPARWRASVARRGALQEPLGLAAQRLAYFCSGCPHNRSTVVPEGSIAAAGIGCHGMAVTMERTGAGFTQMGGEGAQWVGAAYFTGTPHLFQNIGDGTLFHSGTLAIRQAVAASTSITYKILYNGAVAMTGGQHADGAHRDSRPDPRAGGRRRQAHRGR